jgi:hypothetical protein
MERLIGQPFQEGDFARYKPDLVRARELKPANRYPPSWGVMF